MQVIVRLVLAVVAIVMGNFLIPNDTPVNVLSVGAPSYDLETLSGTVLIVVGAFVAARTTVGPLKARFWSRE